MSKRPSGPPSTTAHILDKILILATCGRLAQRSHSFVQGASLSASQSLVALPPCSLAHALPPRRTMAKIASNPTGGVHANCTDKDAMPTAHQIFEHGVARKRQTRRREEGNRGGATTADEAARRQQSRRREEGCCSGARTAVAAARRRLSRRREDGGRCGAKKAVAEGRR